MTPEGVANVHRRRVAVITSYLKVVDLICELVGAPACPKTSGSPAVTGLIFNKQHLLVLNEADLPIPGSPRPGFLILKP